MAGRFVENLTHAIIVRRKVLLIGGIVLAGLSFFPARRVQFDHSMESMFAKRDPLRQRYEKLKRVFGGNEIVLAAYKDSAALTPSGLKRAEKLAEQLSHVPGVANVLSLPRMQRMAPLFRRNIQDKFVGYTHSADGKTASVVCFLKGQNDETIGRSETIDRMREIIKRQPYEGHLAGEPVMVTDGFRYVQEDGNRLSMFSTVLLLIVIGICFRSLRWMLIPLAVVQLTILTTQGLLAIGQFRLSMVSSMLTAIVTVIGVATVVHITVRYRELRATGSTPRDALQHTANALAAPIMWACLTDAVGFCALLVTQVGPVRDFGVMMALGAVLTILSVALLVPGLVLLGEKGRRVQTTLGEDRLKRGLSSLAGLLQRYPRRFAFGCLILFGAIVSGTARLETETDFTKNFKANSPIVESYHFVEDNLGGAGAWDIMLPAPERLDWNYLQRVTHLERRLRSELNTTVGTDKQTTVLSIVDAIPSQLMDRFGDAENPVVTGLVHLFSSRMQKEMPVFMAAMYAEDPDEPGRFYYRLLLRSPERQDYQHKQNAIAIAEKIVAEEFLDSDRDEKPQVTGMFVLLAGLIDSLVSDQWLAFAVATIGIGMMMLVAFRHPLFALAALVPNVLPILMVLGMMGWLGVKINMGAAMIAAVSMGLSVDSSIHYLASYRDKIRGGDSVRTALEKTHQEVGRALVFATIALVVGFAALCQSMFVPTIYFGALVSLAMLGGLIGNLVVLPLLLLGVENLRNNGRTG